jgi:hypothetical protein
MSGNRARQFRDIFPSVIIQKSAVNFASAAASVSNGANVTVTGAGLGDLVLVTPGPEVAGSTAFPSPAPSGGFTGVVTAADTVRVVYHNDSAGTVDLDSIVLTIIVLKTKNFV